MLCSNYPSKAMITRFHCRFSLLLVSLAVISGVWISPSFSQQSTPSDSPRRIRYLGIGGAVGLSDEGETATGEGGFSLVGRTPLTENLSIHTASILSDEGSLSIALTGGAPIRDPSTGRTRIFPFLGAGISIETEDFDTVDPLATGGIDIPLTPTVTGTARLNATFADEGTDIGLILGVGLDVFSLIF